MKNNISGRLGAERLSRNQIAAKSMHRIKRRLAGVVCAMFGLLFISAFSFLAPVLCVCILLIASNASSNPSTTFAFQPWGMYQSTPPYKLVFANSTGSDPAGNLLAAPDGYLYGVTFQGGMFHQGTIFKFIPTNPVKTFQVLHNFGAPLKDTTFSPSDGAQPVGGLVMDKDGNLWGTTSFGGNDFNDGTVFYVNKNDVPLPDGSDPPGMYEVVHAFGGVTVLHTFNLNGRQVGVYDGSTPGGSLTLSTDGTTLYGTTTSGGLGNGIVFSVNRFTYAVTMLHAFNPNGQWPVFATWNGDGAYPTASLRLSPDGQWLYGTTTRGGIKWPNRSPFASGPYSQVYGSASGLGTVYVVNVAGDNFGTIWQNYNVLWAFTGMQDGSWPDSLLVTPIKGESALELVGATTGADEEGDDGEFDEYDGPGTVFTMIIDTSFGTPNLLYNNGPAGTPYLNAWSITEPNNQPSGDSLNDGLCFESDPSGAPNVAGYLPGVVLGTTWGEIYQTTTDGKTFLPIQQYGKGLVYPSGGLAGGANSPYPLAFFGNLAAPQGFNPWIAPIFDEPGPSYGYPPPPDPGGQVIKYLTIPLLSIGPNGVGSEDPPGVVLQTATNLFGAWTVIPDATFPYTNMMSDPLRFFRLAFSVTNLSASAPAVATLPTRTFGSTNATLFGDIIPNGADSTAWLQYGTTTNYGSSTSTISVNATTNCYLVISISGLLAGTTYHYQLIATNITGTGIGSDATFTTLPVGAGAPSATTLAASSVSANSAALNGIVAGNGLNTTIWWQYGTTTNYGLSTSNILASDGPASVSVGGLSPGTLYHFRLVAVNGAGGSEGDDLTFSTAAAAPTTVTAPATMIDSTDFILNGFVFPDGLGTTTWFRYGTTTNYGSVTPATVVSAADSLAAVSNVLSGLTAGATYHCQIFASNAAGTSTGLDMAFTAAPTVATLPVSGIGPTNATLNAFVIPNGANATAWFQWGATTNYGNVAPPTFVSSTNVLFITNVINGLTAGVTYHYRAVATNNAGISTGADAMFATLQSALTLSADGIEPTSATLNGYVISDGFDSLAYFEYGTTTNYGMATAPVFVSGTNASAVFVSPTVAGLSAGTLYHFQLLATNSTGTAVGGDVTFITGQPSCVTPPSGLVNWWPADSNADDIIGGDNGILVGGVSYTNGEVGEAFSFDGSSGYVATSLVVTNPQTFSLTLWFQTTTTNGGVLISFDSDQYIESGDLYDRNIYMDNTGALHFGVWNGAAAQANSLGGYNDGHWHYVVGGLSTNGLSLYIDGALVGNNPAVTNAQETYNGYWRIGQDNLDNWPTQFQPNSYYFQGQIDEVAIFDTALASTNVMAIFDAGSNGMCQP